MYVTRTHLCMKCDVSAHLTHKKRASNFSSFTQKSNETTIIMPLRKYYNFFFFLSLVDRVSSFRKRFGLWSRLRSQTINESHRVPLFIYCLTVVFRFLLLFSKKMVTNFHLDSTQPQDHLFSVVEHFKCNVSHGNRKIITIIELIRSAQLFIRVIIVYLGTNFWNNNN